MKEGRNEWMSELHLVELPIHPFPKPSFSQLPLRWAQLVLHWAIEPPLRWATSFAKLPLFSATSSLTCLLLSGPLLILWPASTLSYLPVSVFAQPLQSVYEPSAAVPHSSVNSLTTAFLRAAVPMRFVTAGCNPAQHKRTIIFSPFRTFEPEIAGGRIQGWSEPLSLSFCLDL